MMHARSLLPHLLCGGLAEVVGAQHVHFERLLQQYETAVHAQYGDASMHAA